MTWSAAEGTVVLLEPSGSRECVTATVVGEHDGHPLVDLGPGSPGESLYRGMLTVSAFAPEALWRVHATAEPVAGLVSAPKGEILELFPTDEPERIQRRLVPRCRVDLEARLFHLDGDEARYVATVGRTLDIGPGGMRIRVGEHLPAASDPTVHLVLPDGDKVVALATVVGMDESGKGFDYRLVFTAISEEDRAALTLLSMRETEAA